MFSLWDHSLETNNWDWITERIPCGTNNHVHHIQSHFNPLYSPLWCSKSSSPRLHALSCHHVIGWWTSPDDAQHKILAKVACDYRPSLSIFINQGVCYSENNNILTQMDSFFFLFVIFLSRYKENTYFHVVHIWSIKTKPFDKWSRTLRAQTSNIMRHTDARSIQRSPPMTAFSKRKHLTSNHSAGKNSTTRSSLIMVQIISTAKGLRPSRSALKDKGEQ